MHRAIEDECKANRHKPGKHRHARLCQRIRGHYPYYGVTGNSRGPGKFLELTESEVVNRSGRSLSVGAMMIVSRGLLPGVLALAALILAGCGEPGPVYREHAPPSGRLSEPVAPEELAGAPVRAVWLLETGDGSDWRAMEQNLVLMGYDSEDGKGNRVLHEGFPNYQKSMLGPDGDVIVFTDWTTHRI